TEALDRAKRQTGQQGNQPPAGGDDPYGDDIPF
ncbi:single-stranded DNA-binding protein, partial [Escherichia coli]